MRNKKQIAAVVGFVKFVAEFEQSLIKNFFNNFLTGLVTIFHYKIMGDEYRRIINYEYF